MQPPPVDPRVRRSRAALFAAVIDLVSRGESANVTTAAIAEAAALSRQVIYQQFGDRDTLVVEAALDLLRHDVLPQIADRPALAPRERALVTARHFAAHRRFYRPVLTSSCASAFSRGLAELHLPPNRALVDQILGDDRDPQTAEDLAVYLTGGGIAFLTEWVVNGADPLDCEQFVDRLAHLHAALDRSEKLSARDEGQPQ
ncbi:TetR family transcriptional regulator [Mycolicibacterium litorale]|uniref:TetR family transcriptional regulator n=1 Tax=Mycolicibacterium litorale TaxID=758802 RepID=UPI0018D9AD6D|nr:TetR family transcriptional regulator [Mycolicibacterium litorale]